MSDGKKPNAAHNRKPGSQNESSQPRNAPFISPGRRGKERPKQSSRNQTDTTEKPKSGRDWPQYILLLGAALGAIATAVFTGRLVSITNATAQKQLRAYAHAAPGGVLNVEVGNPIEGFVWLKNSGQTPAKSVHIKMGMVVTNHPHPDYVMLFSSMWEERGALVIHPRAKHYVRRVARFPLDKDELKNFTLGTRAIYLIGTVTYVDIYGKPHWSKFCHRYIGNRAKLQGGKIDNWYREEEVRYCDKHNDAN